MNDVLLGAVIGVVGTLLAVLLAALLGGMGQHHMAEQQRRNVRTLLHLECERNLTVLNDYWARVNDRLNDQHSIEQYHRVATIPLPVRERLMWESLAPQMAEALSQDEIRRVYDFNARLDALGPMLAPHREAFATPAGIQLWRDYSAWKTAMGHPAFEERDRATKQQGEITGRANVFDEPLTQPWNDFTKLYGALAQHSGGGNHIASEPPPARWALWTRWTRSD